jgi:hypothetical protein
VLGELALEVAEDAVGHLDTRGTTADERGQGRVVRGSA